MKHRFRALTSIVEVDIHDDFTGAALAELIIAGYAPCDEAPSLGYELTNDAVIGVDRYRDIATAPIDIVPMFELDLYQEVATRADPGWLLHAAALEYAGQAFVFAGPSGAGKTTLTLSLMALGWRLITEEMVLIDGDLLVHGLARPIHAPAEGAQRERIPTTWRVGEYPLRVDERTARSIVAQPPLESRVRTSLPLRHLVRLDHGPHHVTSIDLLPAHLALSRLWDCTLRPNSAGLAAATSLLHKSRPRELRSASPSEAVTLALELARFG